MGKQPARGGESHRPKARVPADKSMKASEEARAKVAVGEVRSEGGAEYVGNPIKGTP